MYIEKPNSLLARSKSGSPCVINFEIATLRFLRSRHLTCKTELTGSFQASDPNAMPLADYIAESVNLLLNPSLNGEILVERVRSRRFAESSGNYDQLYAEWNQYAADRAAERADKGQ